MTLGLSLSVKGGRLSPVAASLSQDPWHGHLGLQFYQRQGQTKQRVTRIQAPLRVQRPFYPEGSHRCHSVLLHTAGGLVGGDRLTIEATFAPQTEGLLTTAAATKVYGLGMGQHPPGQPIRNPDLGDPTPQTQLPSDQTVQITVAAAAHGEWLPQETILFRHAQYRQRLRVDLDPGATWLGWDLTRLGRSARGEDFGAGDWRSQTEVWQGDRPLWIDPQWLPGRDKVWHSPQGLAAQPVVATLAWLGQAVTPETVALARQLWHDRPASDPALRPGSLAQVGVTRLQVGLLCRYRGSSTTEARRWFMAIWGLVRSLRGADAPIAPRVWTP